MRKTKEIYLKPSTSTQFGHRTSEPIFHASFATSFYIIGPKVQGENSSTNRYIILTKANNVLFKKEKENLKKKEKNKRIERSPKRAEVLVKVIFRMKTI